MDPKEYAVLQARQNELERLYGEVAERDDKLRSLLDTVPDSDHLSVVVDGGDSKTTLEVAMDEQLVELDGQLDRFDADAEVLRPDLENAIWLDECNAAGHRILEDTRQYQSLLQRLPLALLSHDEARMTLHHYGNLQVSGTSSFSFPCHHHIWFWSELSSVSITVYNIQ